MHRYAYIYVHIIIYIYITYVCIYVIVMYYAFIHHLSHRRLPCIVSLTQPQGEDLASCTGRLSKKALQSGGREKLDGPWD